MYWRTRKKNLATSSKAVLAVFLTTIPLFLIGRPVLGETVIALTYLIPISWSAYRWGQLGGNSAALTAALCLDFIFIPPFYAFAIGSLNGWFTFAVFLTVAVIVVKGIWAKEVKAWQAVIMYEMVSVLATQKKPEAVAKAVACQTQMLFKANQVSVIYQPDKSLPGVVYTEPAEAGEQGKPDRILPIQNSWGTIGEIQIWGGEGAQLPATKSALWENLAHQAGRAFERTDSRNHNRSLRDKLREPPSGH